MGDHNIYVGTTSSGKTAILKTGLQTVTGGGDTYSFLSGELLADSLVPATATLDVRGNIYQYTPFNITTNGKITASTIDATIKWSKISVDTNLDLGDKNLTTTGTVTASNIPSST